MAAWDEDNMLDALEVIRLQKHDFLNYMQMINGYLQLGNTEKALGYIKKATQEIERTGAIMNIVHPQLGINLVLRVHNAYRSGVEISLSTTTDLKQLEPSTGLLEVLNNTFQAVEEIYLEGRVQKEIQMAFSEDDAGYCLTVSFISCSQDAASLLKLRIIRLSKGISGASFDFVSREDQQLEIYFPKNSRSG